MKKLLIILSISIVFSTNVQGQFSVSWTDLENVTDSLSNLYKTGGDNKSWDAGAASINVLKEDSNGSVTVSVGNESSQIAFGLSSINTDENYTSIDYCFRISGTTTRVYHSGELQETISELDIGLDHKIEKSEGVLNYWIGDEVYFEFELEEETDLVVDVSIYLEGDSIDDISCSFEAQYSIVQPIIHASTDSTSGSIELNLEFGNAPYEFIWNSIDYPTRDSLYDYFMNENIFDSINLNIDTVVYDFVDSLRYNNQSPKLISSKVYTTVIDSSSNTQYCITTVGATLHIQDSSGLSIPVVDTIPKQIDGDSVFYFSTGLKFSKDYGDGTWDECYFISANSFPPDEYGSVQFSVPSLETKLAVGFYIDTNQVQSGYDHMQYLTYFDTGDLYILEMELVAVLDTGPPYTPYFPGYDTIPAYDTLYTARYNSGDFFEIELIPENGDGNYFTVDYKKNGNIMHSNAENVHAFGVSHMYLQASIYTNEAEINNVIIVNPSLGIQYQHEITHTDCVTETGSIEFDVLDNGSIEMDSLSYLWLDSQGDTVSVVNDLSNASQGEYTLTITYKYIGTNNYFSKLIEFYIDYQVNWQRAVNLDIETDNELEKKTGVSAGWNAYAFSSNRAPTGEDERITFFADNSSNASLQIGYLTTDENFQMKINHGVMTRGNLLMPIETGNAIRRAIAFDVDKALTLSKTNNGTKYDFVISQESGLQLPCSTMSDVDYRVVGGIYLADDRINKPTCSFNCEGMNSFTRLDYTLDGGFHTAHRYLHFIYDEQYYQNDSTELNYSIVDDDNISISNLTVLPLSHGINRYSVDLTTIENGSQLDPGYYILTVKNDKNEKWYLRFLYEQN